MKVSIIIPYNQDRGWLSEAVASCEHQEGMKLNEDYEIIIEHGGLVGENMNRGILKAKGEFIKKLDEDDRLTPNCLKDLYEFAVKNDLDFVCADSYTFEKYPLWIDLFSSTIPEVVYMLADRNTIHGGTILYRKSKIPKWNEEHWTGEEYAVTLEMAANGCKFGKLDKVVYWYRIHPDQKSLVYKSQNGEMIKKRYRYIQHEIKDKYMNCQVRIIT